MAILRFILKRAWYTRAILLPVLLGVLAVVTVLCSVPLLATDASEADLQKSLGASGPILSKNLEVQFTTPPLDAATYTQATGEVTANVQGYLGQQMAPTAPFRSGSDAHLLIYATDNHTSPENFVADYLPQPSMSALWFHSDMDAAHLTLTAGQFPSPDVTMTQTSLGTAYEVEAMIAPDWATQLHLKLNDELDLLEAPGQAKRFLRIRLVGFFQPKSLDDPAWFGNSDPFVPAIHFGDTPDLPPPPFWINETAFETALPQLGLKQSLVYTWFYDLNLQGVSATTAQTTLDNFQALKRLFEQPAPGGLSQSIHYSALTQVDSLLQTFFKQQFFVTIATLIAVLPGLALLLLYVGLAAAALAERHRDEVALMKSRGASAWQVLTLSGIEALLLCGLALLLAPLLAAQVTHLITGLSFFGSAAGGSGDLLTPTLQTYLYAAVAAALCAVALLVPAIAAARSSAVALRRHASRARRAPLWLRLGPGVLLAALGVFGYSEISQHGTFFTANLQGGLTVDWVTATAPTLLLLGAAGLSLLLLPLLLAVLDRISRRLPGVAASLALRQMAGRPAPYSRLVLLLTLTLALGMFASLFSGTLVSSAADRAAYQSGSDLRLVEGKIGLDDLDRQAAPLADHLALLPGVTDGMNVLRDTQTRPAGVLQGAEVTALAIDSAKFAQVAYWRPDFADSSLSTLMQALRAPVSRQGALPAIVDDRLLQATGMHLGDELLLDLGAVANGFETIPVGANVVIVGTFHYFPTLDTSQYAIVCDINRLLQQINVGLPFPVTPNEVWLKLAANAPQYTAAQVAERLAHNPQQKQVVVTVQQAYDREALLATLRSDPLHFSVAGALSLDFVVAALLSVIGFIVLFYLIAQRRAFEFGVLRAMGLSLRQLTGSLGWEQLTLILAAVVFGGALGVVIANVTLPALATDEGGQPLLPPFVIHLDVSSVLQLGLFLVACALAALAATLVIFRRLQLQEVLRLGEE